MRTLQFLLHLLGAIRSVGWHSWSVLVTAHLSTLGRPAGLASRVLLCSAPLINRWLWPSPVMVGSVSCDAGCTNLRLAYVPVHHCVLITVTWSACFTCLKAGKSSKEVVLLCRTDVFKNVEVKIKNVKKCVRNKKRVSKHWIKNAKLYVHTMVPYTL